MVLFVNGVHVSVGVGLECASVRAPLRALCLLVRANVCVCLCACVKLTSSTFLSLHRLIERMV